jgi:hypothetical protein
VGNGEFIRIRASLSLSEYCVYSHRMFDLAIKWKGYGTRIAGSDKVVDVMKPT